VKLKYICNKIKNQSASFSESNVFDMEEVKFCYDSN
jgi:hypothetical protein